MALLGALAERLSLSRRLLALPYLFCVVSFAGFVGLVEALRDGIDDHEGLVRRIVDEFEVDRETAAGDVDAFVEELAQYLVDRRA